MSEDCPICYEKMDNEKSQICGHIVHLDCLKKQFKPECPLCRTKLDIVVQGTLNGISTTNENDTYLESYYEEKLDQYNEWLSENINDYDDEDDEDDATWRWASRGYNYPEEDPEFDEENPRGDDWHYDDEE